MSPELGATARHVNAIACVEAWASGLHRDLVDGCKNIALDARVALEDFACPTFDVAAFGEVCAARKRGRDPKAQAALWHLVQHALDSAFYVAFGKSHAVAAQLDEKGIGFVDLDAPFKDRLCGVGDPCAKCGPIGILCSRSIGVNKGRATKPVFGRARLFRPVARGRRHLGIREDRVSLGLGVGTVIAGIA